MHTFIFYLKHNDQFDAPETFLLQKHIQTPCQVGTYMIQTLQIICSFTYTIKQETLNFIVEIHRFRLRKDHQIESRPTLESCICKIEKIHIFYRKLINRLVK